MALDTLLAFLALYRDYFLIGILSFQVVLLLLLWHSFNEMRRLNARIKRLSETGEGLDLPVVIEKLKDLKKIQINLDKLWEKIADLQVSSEKSFSRVGLVRFNAFSDISSELSFALALLSREGSGFIITNIYSRDDNRVFIKTVQGGKALQRLSEEEENALAIALGIAAPEKKLR